MITLTDPKGIMVKTLSANMRDGEVVAIGVNSPLVLAASWLAKETHSPDLTIILAGSFVDPEPNGSFRFCIDYVEDFLPILTSGRLDLIVYGGLQVDKYGNINMHYIERREQPPMVGPGVPAITPAAYARNYDILLDRHDKRVFVDRVDFISVPGYFGERDRSERGFMGSGPRLVITPIAVLTFDKLTMTMKLKSIHPSSSLEEVTSNTGFHMIRDEKIEDTPVPEPPESKRIRRLINRASQFVGTKIY